MNTHMLFCVQARLASLGGHVEVAELLNEYYDVWRNAQNEHAEAYSDAVSHIRRARRNRSEM